MANIYETIYPKFKKEFSYAELNEIYTPTDAEFALVKKLLKGREQSDVS